MGYHFQAISEENAMRCSTVNNVRSFSDITQIPDFDLSCIVPANHEVGSVSIPTNHLNVSGMSI